MKIWEIYIPSNSEYAELISLYVKPEITFCDICRNSEIPILRVEWEDGSDVIGDFISAGARVVAKKNVLDDLDKEFSGFEKTIIEMVDHPNLYRPKKITKKNPKRIWLPYEGPKLFELTITKELPLHEKSTVTVKKRCEACGTIRYKSFDGIEKKNSRGHIPRKTGMGLYFNESDLAGYDFFKPIYTGFVLCTERVKSYIESKQYTNIDFLEVGETIGDGGTTGDRPQ